MADASGSDDLMLALEEPASVSLSRSSPVSLRFVKSRKGGNIAILDFHTYIKNRNLARERTYWNCRKKEKLGCKGSLILDSSNNVESSTEHNHVASASEAQADEALAALRKRARKSLTKPRRLHSDLVQQMPLEVTSHLPSAHNLARMVRRQRETQMPVPTRLEDIDLDSYFQKSELGSECVLYDSGSSDPNRIIVFKAEDFRYLHQAATWIMDGTFSICPPLSLQLYSIHVELFGIVFPILFALLPNKTTSTYERLFRVIRHVLESMPFTANGAHLPKPENIIVDYEKAVINTVGKLFPHTRVQGISAKIN